MRARRLIPETESKIFSGELNMMSVSQAQGFFRQEDKGGKKYSVEEKRQLLKKLENKSTRECVKELMAISPEALSADKRRQLTPTKTELKIVIDQELALKKVDPELRKPRDAKALSALAARLKKQNKYIPRPLRAVVFKRDGLKCTHPGCSSKYFLEIDHKIPYALGGSNDLENLRLLCFAHNQRAVIEKYGIKHMGQFIDLHR